jgi:hypothetical protein
MELCVPSVFSCRIDSTLPVISRPCKYDSFSHVEYAYLQMQCPHSVLPKRLWKFVCGFGLHAPYCHISKFQLISTATADLVDVVYLNAYGRVDTRPYKPLMLHLLMYSPIKWMTTFKKSFCRH